MEVVETELLEDLLGGFVAFIAFQVLQLPQLRVDVQIHSGHIVQIDKVFEGIGLFLGDLLLLHQLGEARPQHMLPVVLPDSPVMRLRSDVFGDFVGVDEVVLVDHFWDHGADLVEFLLELVSALLGGGVDAEDHGVVLVGVGEGVEVLLMVVQVASEPPPSGLGGLIVEQPAGSARSPLLKPEPLEGVGFEAFSHELDGGPLGAEVVEGIVPGLSRVVVHLPPILLLRRGPIRHFEPLKQGSWSSVEGDVPDPL
mmetsp:Transcript_10238/g.10205  ORF Transcript_10238/g.10205 Transcript_10238/m.10205 type:complete len:254 (+) Transcript_10238:239-1000(+)